MSTPAVEVNNVSLSFRGQRVLEHISFAVDQGEFMGLIGPNGGGKTVLLKVILGLLQPSEGTVRLFGQSPRAMRGRVGYVPQFARFDSSFPICVRDVVLMGRLRKRRLGRRYTQQDRAIVAKAMRQMQVDAFAEKQIGKLSGGQLQRVLIARALAVEPDVLLLDEPTSNLDPGIGGSIYDMLADQKRNITIMLVSHDLGVISRHVNSIGCLNQKLHYHPSGEVTSEEIEATYGCPVDFIVHSHTHRVLEEHEHGADG